MECSPIVVGSDLNGHGSSIWIVRSSHKCSSNVVVPLVGRCWNGCANDVEKEAMNDKRGETEFGDSVSICGVGLLMSNSHFVVGTGPLFWFDSDDVLSRGMSVETSLVCSRLVNVSSSSPFTQSEQKFGSEVTQLVVGSCESCCTNHDSGTGMMSPNMGGNVVCLNTSFSSCVRTSNDEIDMKHENITATNIKRTVVDSTSGMTSVKFTLCTFEDMTIAGEDGHAGAAIHVYLSQSTLNVTQCFFHKCTCTADNDDGGAIYVHEPLTDCPITISLSSFTECADTGMDQNYGGSRCESLLSTHTLARRHTFAAFSPTHRSCFGVLIGTLHGWACCRELSHSSRPQASPFVQIDEERVARKTL
ncbi:hypothetical protein BLNAU_19513 [Blattamonas nauphoetae]|uniref:Uncharacterized protein n=1 Tax=Blattamonas nauphoetae TaxID=2049346 RepID=A0ABQ9X189_9EUKA|nr:hypothetical protein BLNAU_19513 [Blattamonas nauphoetae]